MELICRRGDSHGPMFYSVLPLLFKNLSKVTLSVCAYCAFGAFRAFSCDSDVTPTF